MPFEPVAGPQVEISVTHYCLLGSGQISVPRGKVQGCWTDQRREEGE